MHAHLFAARAFSVNVLAAGQEAFASHFAGRPLPEFTAPFITLGGALALADASARIAADLASAMSAAIIRFSSAIFAQ
jgi:flavin reductase (DIM6/NTAB) family NADH-FMN oxidoreductase RutF